MSVARRFPGGLRLAAHKEAATRPMQVLPVRGSLRISLLQHAGLPALPVVEVGQRVRAGQLLGRADGATSAAVHAPCSGVVEAIERAPNTLPPAPLVTWLVLRTVGDDAVELLPALDLQSDPAALRHRMTEAGIVGLGGGGFATAQKFSGGVHTLILNGVECEPHIACDDRLLRERAAAVLDGGRVLARAFGITALIIALEDSMLEAAAAVRAALGEQTDIEMQLLPERYPQGGERQLILSVCGREVPRGGLPRDVGVCVVNVGTAHAVWQAVSAGQPLTRRWISVSGAGIRQPGVFEAAIGTPVAALVAAAGGYTQDAVRLFVGGSMMGLPLADDQQPVGKLHNAILVECVEAIPARAQEMPCIRCGDCATACPSRLLPHELHRHATTVDSRRLDELGLFDCIECGCCDLVCPSQIPLTAQFRLAKQQVQLQQHVQQQADAARVRFEARQTRFLRDSDARAQQRAARQDSAADPVKAALARARAKLGRTAEPNE